MQEIVYGDILFIINFSMDFLSLFITAAVLHRKVNTLALIMASGIGSLYAVVCLFLESDTLLTLFINTGVSALMCYIVFAAEKIFGYIKALVLFYAVSFLTGGGITALYNLLNSLRGSQKILINGNISSVTSNIPLHWFVIFAALSLILSFIIGRVFNSGSKQKSVDITAKFGQSAISFSGLVDSGNLLKEPISGMPVIVTSYEVLKPLLPDKIRPIFENRDTERLYTLDFSLIRRVKVIPMSAVGHSGILMGFVPDNLSVNGISVEACIAADLNDADSDFGGFQSVAPALLVE